MFCYICNINKVNGLSGILAWGKIVILSSPDYLLTKLLISTTMVIYFVLSALFINNLNSAEAFL